jgi:hypothetical protein
MKKATLLMLALLLFSCQKSSEAYEGNYLILKGIIQKNDEFQLFYSRSLFKEYNEKQSVKKRIKGSPNVQKIKFEIPNGFSPLRIRLDLGNNIDQKKIVIRGMTMYMCEKKEYISKDNFNDFFFCNENAEFKKESGAIEFNLISGSYDPYFISKNLSL